MAKKKAVKAVKAAPTNETAKDEKPMDDDSLPQKDLFRIDEVAKYFSVSDRTIRLWIDHGHFECEKLHGSLRIVRRSIVGFRLKSRMA